MNPQLPGIEWTHPQGRPGYTANPVRGCEHACRWTMPDGSTAICYAESIATRLAQKAYPHGFAHLSFHPEELAAIRKLKAPSAIFLDSMSDVFGKNVNSGWILQTLITVHECPQHIFFTLTKNPRRMVELLQGPRAGGTGFPANLWLGISAPPTEMFGKPLNVELQRTWLRKALGWLHQCQAGVRWISLEPLSFDAADILADHPWLDWAVIGAASNGSKTYQPDETVFQRTLDALTCPVFYKGNLSRDLADRWSGWREEYPTL